MIKIALFFSLLISTVTAFAAESFLPEDGKYEVDVLTQTMPKEAQDLVMRFNAAVASNSTWMSKYVADVSRPGEPLPYHKNFGISKEEYSSLLSAAKNTSLVKTGDATVLVNRSNAGIAIKIEGMALPFDTFHFNSDESVMDCEFGKSTALVDIDNRDPASPTGKWRGKQWKVTKNDTDLLSDGDLYQVAIAVGEDAKKRTLIYINIMGRKSQESLSIRNVLRWAPKK